MRDNSSGQNESIKVKNIRHLTAHVKFHQICTLIGSFCWKCIEFQLKKYRGVIPHGTGESCNIWKKLVRCFKNDKNLVSFNLSTSNSQNFYFDWFLFCKVCNVWPKNVQRSYLSWHSRLMQNLKKNWLVVWKSHEECRKFLTELLKFSKLRIWWNPFIQSRQWISLNFAEELYVMTMKNDAKF